MIDDDLVFILKEVSCTSTQPVFIAEFLQEAYKCRMAVLL
jgi:hypothetical protein